ncbi:hypothetical protein Barb6_02346 [Bacteroidales bacterium Barb6]|nr:hypothetical protein Barb6_02346 [Bacteroidales bacterium Barb6]
MIDEYKRYQKGLVLDDLYPKMPNNTCACGCGRKLTGRKKKWFDRQCMLNSLRQFFIVKGDAQVIREEVFKRDRGYCRTCGAFSPLHPASISPNFLLTAVGHLMDLSVKTS